MKKYIKPNLRIEEFTSKNMIMDTSDNYLKKEDILEDEEGNNWGPLH